VKPEAHRLEARHQRAYYVGRRPFPANLLLGGMKNEPEFGASRLERLGSIVEPATEAGGDYLVRNETSTVKNCTHPNPPMVNNR
jgi:hypothetical protein